MEVAYYHRAGDVLKISGSLDQVLDAQFDIEMRALLDDAAAQGVKDVVVDLRSLTTIRSQYLGALASVASEMRKQEGGLTVLARGRIAGLIQEFGLGRIVNLDIEEPDAQQGEAPQAIDTWDDGPHSEEAVVERRIPQDLLYTSDGYWIRSKEHIATVGVTDRVQSEIGTIVYADLPKVDSKLRVCDRLGGIESVRMPMELHAPVSGEVIAVNEGLAVSPNLINRDPYGDGWIAKIKLTDPSEIDDLWGANEYERRVQEED